MLIPIVCTCGRSIGDVYEAFKARRERRIIESLRERKVDVSTINLRNVEGIYPDLGDVLDEYHFTRECCRRTLLTSIDFYDMFKLE